MPIDFSSLEAAVQDTFGGVAVTLSTRDGSGTGSLAGIFSVVSREDQDGEDSRIAVVMAEFRVLASAAAVVLGRLPDVRDTFASDGIVYTIERVDLDQNGDDVAVLRGMATVRSAEYAKRGIKRDGREG